MNDKKEEEKQKVEKNKLLSKKLLITTLVVLSLLITALLAARSINQDTSLISPLGKRRKIEPSPTPLPLEKYSFENLKKRTPIPSKITLNKLIEQNDEFSSYIFSYTSEDKTITGVANIPNRGLKSATTKDNQFPTIIMFRGWVDENVYESGIGTQPSAQVYAQNGYITLAIDFLGYGNSDPAPVDIWENRFIKNINIQDLLASIELGKIYQDNQIIARIDPERIALWGHSNGGLSALTALELFGKSYPTVLWAPVSQFFPYDVLYYTFEQADKGKFLRQKIAEFEKDYDIDKYSLDEYFDWISAPIQLHQGTGDMYIPVYWSNSLVERLESIGNEVNYFVYPGADHQLSNSWDTVVQRDIQFFNEQLK
jgi:dipeptidyl aminopeptidase/acylaminoacyl peptidase